MSAAYTKLADNITQMRQKWASKKKKNAVQVQNLPQIFDQEIDSPVNRQKKFNNMKFNVAEDINYTHPEQYLNSITTSINCETDLQLYKIKHCQSNQNFGMVGVQIISDSLQAAYHHNKYLIRCYYSSQKFLELPLKNEPFYIGMIGSLIVYIFNEDVKTIHILHLEAPESLKTKNNLDRNNEKNRSKALVQCTVTQEFVSDANEIISIKLSPFSQKDTAKLIIVTKHKVHMVGVSANPALNQSEQFNKLSHEPIAFDFNNSEHLKKLNGQNQDSQNNALDKSKSDAQTKQQRQILQFYDYGSSIKINDDLSFEKENELIVAKDSMENFHIFSSSDQGTKFQRVARIPHKTTMYDSRIAKERNIIDVALISNTKILTIEKVSFAQDIKTSNLPKATNQQVHYQENETILKLQVWEINDDKSLTKTTSLKIKDGIDSKEVLDTWKSLVFIDSNNNEFYLPNYSSNDGTFYKLKIDNEISKYLVQTSMTAEVIKDIIGCHQSHNQHNSGLKGYLYSDFIVLDSLLVISHGRYLTVTDIMLPVGKYQQHLTLTEDLSSLKGPYDMSSEICGVYLNDKVTSNNELRWKILVFFGNGYVQEVVTVSVPDEHPESLHNHLVSVDLISSSGVNVAIPNYLPKFQYQLQNYLKDKDGKNVGQIKGNILKVYKNYNDETVPLLILVEKQDKSLSFCTIQPYKQTLRENNKVPYLKKKTTVILLNTKDKLFQDVMLINTDIDEEGEVIEQFKYCIRLKIDSTTQDKDGGFNVYGVDKMPREMNNIQKSNKIYIFGEDIYFVHSNYIEKYDIGSGEFEKVMTSDYSKFAYWRQNRRNKNIFSLESTIIFDCIDSLTDMKNKGQNKDFTIFSGVQPHLDQIYYDNTSETLSAFVDYNTIKVWPLLHRTKLKLRGAAKRHTDSQIIATQLIGHKLYSIHSNGIANEWNIKNAKLITQKQIKGLEDYVFHQAFDSNYIMLRSTKTRTTCLNAPIKTQVDENQQEEEEKIDLVNLIKEQRYNKRMKDDSNGIYGRFNINPLCFQIVAITDYKIIQIQSVAHNNELDEFSQNSQSFVHQSKEQLYTIGDAVIKDIMSFEGPCEIENNNYGLFASSDLSLFTFYFKDTSSMMKLYYYKKYLDPSTNKTHLIFEVEAKPDITLSMHSKELKHYLRVEPLSGNTQLTNYQQHQKLDTNEQACLIGENEALQTIDDMSEEAPCFISNHDVVFINKDYMLTFYNVFSKEVISMITRCPFEGTDKYLNLNNIFKSHNHIIGEDLMIAELNCGTGYPSEDFQLMTPNNFNQFFKEMAKDIEKESSEDATENKYIQLHYKTKVELMHRSQFGYIYQAHEYLPTESYKSEIHIVTTFSYFHWRLIKLIKNKIVDIDDLDNHQLHDLCFTQLPDGSTLLHQVMTNQTIIEQIFNTIREQNLAKYQFYVPILQDNMGKTVFDYLLQPKENQTMDRYNHKLSRAAQKQILQNLGQVAVSIMNSISYYPFDLFKIRVKHLMRSMMDTDIGAFASFLDSRCIPLNIYANIGTACSSNQAVIIFSSDDVTFQKDIAIENILKSSDPEAIQVQLKVLDMPHIHNRGDQKHWGNDTLNSIYNTLSQNPSNDVFSNDIIKALVEVRWHYIKSRIIIFLMIPYMAFMCVIFSYLTLDYISFQTIKENDDIQASKKHRIAMFVLLGYFTAMQSIQLFQTGVFQFFKQLWHYIDVLIIGLIISAEVVLGVCRRQNSDEMSDEQMGKCIIYDQVVRTLYSFVALLMFTRCLYFFRIFRSTGYYIRMFFEVIKDIWHFVFIYLFVVVAFSLAFFVFEKNNSSGPTLSNMKASLSWTYLTSFGEYDIDQFADYKPPISWLFFMLLQLLISIVLMNLLISIVSDTYGRIKGDYNIIMYQDMMQLINENKYFAFGKQKDILTHKYLFIAAPVQQSAQDKINSDKIDAIMKQVRDNGKHSKKMLSELNMFKKIEDKEQLIQERLENIEEKIKKIIDKLDNKVSNK